MQPWHVWVLVVMLSAVALTGLLVHHLATRELAHRGEGVGLAERETSRTAEEAAAVNRALRRRASATIALALVGLLPVGFALVGGGTVPPGLAAAGYAVLLAATVPLMPVKDILGRAGRHGRG